MFKHLMVFILFVCIQPRCLKAFKAFSSAHEADEFPLRAVLSWCLHQLRKQQ